ELLGVKLFLESFPFEIVGAVLTVYRVTKGDGNRHSKECPTTRRGDPCGRPSYFLSLEGRG
ncbi:hypothetical protein MUO65_08750, partial [bacterium]|nr:hypothetical protein [bacterium]